MGDMDRLRQQVENELYDGESLLWVSKPSPMRIVGKNAAALLPAALMLVVLLFVFPEFLGFGMMGFRGGFASPISAFALVFLLILFFAIGQPLWSIFSEIGAIYAITDQRALIISPGLSGRSVRSYSEADIKQIERRERANGTGDIIFDREERARRYRRSRGFYAPRGYTVDIGFFGIPEVREVELLMLETFKMGGAGDESKRKHAESDDVDA